MKTAEEWFKELDEVFVNSMDIEDCRKALNKAIREIQLDAWKQGMSDAIETAEHCGISQDDTENVSRLQSVCNWFGKVKKRITDKRDSKTTI